MSRTNIEINDAACATVMKRFNLTTKREAVNFALQLLAAEAMTLDEARSLKGSGWVGDLDVMRESRVS
jgi:Arc/MetJ family transcription regulator